LGKRPANQKTLPVIKQNRFPISLLL
jgi:hypothetical protein